MAIISRNYVRRPRFTNDTDLSTWGAMASSGTIAADGEVIENNVAAAIRAASDPITGGEGYRLNMGSTSRDGLGTFLPDLDVVAGDTVRATVTFAGAASNVSIVLALGWEGLTSSPVGVRNNYVDETALAYPLPVHATYIEVAFDFTVPEVFGLKYADQYGEYTVPAEVVPRWYLAFRKDSTSGNLSALGFSGFRADVVKNEVTYVPGYADGSMAPFEDITYAWAGTPFESVTEIDQVGAIEPITPPVATFTDDPPRFTLPDAPNVTWSVNDEIMAPGAYGVVPTEEGFTVSIFPIADEGFEFVPPAETQVHTWIAPPTPTPGDWPEGITPGGELVARWLKMTSESDKEECSFYYDVALNYVWGYTKGKGFDEDMVPAKPLQRVIVSGAARIAYNPESVHRWQISSESEYLTVFNGFNLAEQAVLNRYRVRWA